MADETIKEIMDKDQRAWYFMEDGNKVPVPKIPLLTGDISFSPPASVTLWNGQVREILADEIQPQLL